MPDLLFQRARHLKLTVDVAEAESAARLVRLVPPRSRIGLSVQAKTTSQSYGQQQNRKRINSAGLEMELIVSMTVSIYNVYAMRGAVPSIGWSGGGDYQLDIYMELVLSTTALTF